MSKKAETPSKQSVVLNADGAVVRTYSEKEHGKNHKDLAKQFASNEVNVKRHGEMTVK